MSGPTAPLHAAVPAPKAARFWSDHAFALLILASALLLVALGAQIGRKAVEVLATPRDNTQWSLAQLDVEFLALADAVGRSRSGGLAALDDVRSRFDIFYSRIRTAADMIERDRPSSPAQEALARLQAGTDRIAAIVDEATDLAPKLGDLDAELVRLRPLVRQATLAGVSQFAAAADTERRQFFDLLVWTAVVDGVLICGLVATLAVLYRQIRISRRNAEGLRERDDRYARTIEASLDAIVATDLEGVVLDFNPAAEELFGYSREEAIGRRMELLMVPPRLRAAHVAGMARYRQTGVASMIGCRRVETAAMRADGSEFPVELSLAAVGGACGPVVVAFARDISKRVEAERALEAARDEALAIAAAKSRFVAVMSHEMRTPLNGVVGTLDILKETGLTRGQTRLVETALTSAEVLNQHIDDVLDLSRIQANKLELIPSEFDPLKLLDEVRRITIAAATARGNRVTIEAPASLPRLHADRRRLQQVVLNLVANAIKFTSEGEIRIRASLGEARQGWASLEVSVSDTGVGVAPDQLGRIFEDFVTGDASYKRKAAGAGLGLPICRSLVTAMGGEIDVESEVGSGSRFWFRVPLRLAEGGDAETAAPCRREVEDPGRRSRPLRALVVEDIETNRMVVRTMLQSHGCEVALAVDGEDGVRQAEQAEFDVILMDISMPGLDGVEAARRVRGSAAAASRDAPIFALTAHALPEEREAFLAAGMQGCLVKPVRSRAIRDLVAGLRTERAPEAAEAQ